MASEQSYDIIVVGAGIAAAGFLERFLELQGGTPREAPCRIAVIDKAGEFWRGIPYGDRSSVNSLLITNFRDFVPDALKSHFVGWLTEHKGAWMDRVATDGGNAGRNWLRRNAALLEAEAWDELYLPRWLFGEFLHQRMTTAVAAAQAHGCAQVDLIAAEATDIARSAGGFAVSIGQGVSTKILRGRKVVLAVGSPPVARPTFHGKEAPTDALFINDLYQDGVDANFETIVRTMRRRATDRNILVIGTNASAMEFFYLLSQARTLLSVTDQVTCISPSGRFPVVVQVNGEARPFTELSRVGRALDFSAADVFAAIEVDAARLWRENGFDGAIPELIATVTGLLARLPTAEQRVFHDRFGMAFTRVVRRCGVEYGVAANELVASGVLQVLPGRLESLRMSPTSQSYAMMYSDGAGSAPLAHASNFGVVINCGGFEEPGLECSTPLLRNLVRRDICRVNACGRGFSVGDDFEAAEGLFVAGPLLAGIFGRRLRTWHIENARRIHDASTTLGDIVYRHRAEDRRIDGPRAAAVGLA